ncbi:MAG: helix-turn-helix domain-containing protein [archaeon]
MESLLKKLGLNAYESQAYLTLIKYKTLAAKDIAKLSKVPPTAIYPNLKSLENKNLISLVTKDPLTYKIIDPKIGLKSFKESIKKYLDSTEEEILKEFKDIKSPSLEEEEDFLNILKGWKQSAELVKNLISHSSKEFLLISGMTEKTAYVILNSVKKALKRKVDVKFIINQKPDKNKGILKEFTDLGAHIKYYPMKNFALEVRDSKESVIVLRNPKLKDRVVVHMINPDLAKAHRDYFYTIWKKSKPLT